MPETHYSDDANPVGAAHPPNAADAYAPLGRTATLRRKIAEQIARSRGMTDDELELALDRTHQSVSGCRRGLVKNGWVVDSGQTRVNRHGNDAIVWAPTAALDVSLGTG